MYEPRISRAAFAALATFGSATVLGAAEYCVQCTAPPASYVCAVGGAAGNLGAQPAAEQIQCIAELAARGGHQTCTVNRLQSGPCPGQRVVLESATPAKPAAPAATAPQTPAIAARPAETVIAKPRADAEAPPRAGPDIAAKPAPSAIEKAGSAVSDAAKKSWDCVSSFFKSC